MKTWNAPGIATTTEESPREKQHRAIARKAAAEGIVLLKNDGVLPLAAGSRVALYGGGARHTIIGGTGSGSVNVRGFTSIEQGLLDAGYHIVNGDWLDSYDRAYDQARQAWMASIYAMSEPGDFTSLYTAHASHPLPMPKGDAVVRGACPEADAAVFVISRVSGEGADRRYEAGDYLLSDAEAEALREVASAYDRTIVILNVGGIIDLGFMDELPVSALVLLSQPGMEGGAALADVLSGAVNPSGRLTDTWAYRYGDYPGSADFSHNNGNVIEEKYAEGIYVGYRYFDTFGVKPRFPFGFGLSYTRFEVAPGEPCVQGDALRVPVTVTNAGERAGRQVVQCYAACPDGLRLKERKRLVDFAKTRLLEPGDSETLTLTCRVSQLASYHAGRSSWYYDRGLYGILVGTDALSVEPVAALTLAETAWERPLQPVCPLRDALKEIRPDPSLSAAWDEAREALFKGARTFPLEALLRAKPDRAKAAEREPSERVKRILASLTPEEKARLACGQPRGGEEGLIGAAAQSVPGAAGQTTTRLADKGVGSIVVADGPAGLRISQRFETDPATGELYVLTPYEGLENRIFKKQFTREGAVAYYQYCTAVPVGTMLAQTFDPSVPREIGRLIAREMADFGVAIWLAPGMNIHRNPLCGRNFEYCSEDPLVSGRMAAAITDGVQSMPGRGTTIKHFACNNQEENRRGVSSIVSERALREIYLKGFEIAVRESQPMAIMTSYNKINGEHTANSRDLCTVLAREEWGFEGIIMTDWTTTNSDGGSSAAKCVAAGNDLVMPGLPSDIREIVDALRRDNDQCLDEAALDACCLRLLSAIERCGGLAETV